MNRFIKKTKYNKQRKIGNETIKQLKIICLVTILPLIFTAAIVYKDKTLLQKAATTTSMLLLKMKI